MRSFDLLVETVVTMVGKDERLEQGYSLYVFLRSKALQDNFYKDDILVDLLTSLLFPAF